MALERPWVGMGNACNKEDMDLLYLLTRVTTSDGNKADFWSAPWANGISPKSIAPLIYKISKQETCSVYKALANDTWINHIDTCPASNHIQEFMKLWEITSELHIDDNATDPILWKLNTTGSYSWSSA
jgi:hypothetical protein